jgi:hypothetical protein
LVSTDEQGRKQVDYSGLIAPLIEPVKELDDRVRTLEARCGQAGERTGQEGQPEADRTIHRGGVEHGLRSRATETTQSDDGRQSDRSA